MRSPYLMALAATMVVTLSAAGATAARPPLVDQRLQETMARTAPDGEVQVIISMADRVDPTTFTDRDRGKRRARLVKALRTKAESRQVDLRQRLFRNRKAKRMQDLWLINGISATIPASMVEELAALPGIDTIRLDQVVAEPALRYGASANPGWNLTAVGAPSLWQQGVVGQGVVVAIFDSGADPFHPQIGPKWRGGANSWYDPHGENAEPHDSSGHGTQVAGLIVGDEGRGQAIGMAPGARWIAAKIFNNAGEATYSAIHASFQWVLDPDGNPDVDDAPDIVNNSWGLQQTAGRCVLEFAPDIAVLRAANIAVVFAAGNDGPQGGSSVSPANNPGSTTVGAVGQSLVVDISSSRGPSACDGAIYPQLVAPGVNVLTTDLTFDGLVPDSFVEVSGTSFAAPHLSGALALLKSAVPKATLDELETAITGTSLDLGEPGPDMAYGHGLLDVAAAFAQLTGGVPLDLDADGFTSEVDCDDTDPQIHPGALEIRHDGRDQDCNGYDLTIKIPTAQYQSSSEELTVVATSKLGDGAGLKMTVTMNNGQKVTRALIWVPRLHRWQRRINLGERKFYAMPITVAVKGVEGALQRKIVVR